MAAVLSKTRPKARADRARSRLAGVFQRDVAPDLADLERRRLQHRLGYGLAAAGMLAGIFAVFFLVRDLRDALFAGVVVLALGLVVMQAIQRRYRHLVRRAVMPAVCAAIGDLSHDVGGASDLNLSELARIGLVPGHCRERFDDVFHGRYRATGFTMAEVRLRRDGHGRRRRSRSVFHGVIFAIETPRPVPARILIARDGGMIGNGFKGLVRKFGGMQRVALPDPVFEQCFEVYADRPEVARATVTAELRANLVALAEAHRGARFQVALADGRLFLAMPRRGDLFAAGSLFRSTGQLEGEAARLLEDVQVVHRVIDYLHGDRPELRSQAKERSASQGDAPGPVVRA